MDAKVINEARTFLRNFRSVLSFADMVDQIGTWEGALTEIKISAKDEQAKLDRLKEDLKALEKEHEKAKKEIAAAKQKVTEIEADAQRRAAEILKKADAAATESRNATTDVLIAEQQKLAEVRQETGRVASQRDAALAELRATETQHAALKERILNG